MKKNMGKLDRGLRLILGVMFATAAYLTDLWWLYIFAVIMLVTSFVGFCPLYKPFNFATIRKKLKK